MDEILLKIVEEIGKLKDSVDDKSWEICEAIHGIFEEMGRYSRELTPLLKSRLKISKTALYNHRNAWELRQKVGDEYNLTFTHFARMRKLSDLYNLSLENVKELLQLARDEALSVESMAVLVDQMFDPDYDKVIRRRFEKLVKLLEQCWVDADEVELPDDLRHDMRRLYTNLKEWL